MSFLVYNKIIHENVLQKYKSLFLRSKILSTE